MPVAYGARIGLCAIGAYGLLPSTMRPIGRIRGRFSYIMSATASAPAGRNVPASPAATRAGEIAAVRHYAILFGQSLF